MEPRASPPSIDDPRLALAGVRHGFFTRVGGVSTGMYTSLNCGIGSRDERAAIAENRARVATAMGATTDRLATPYQVHGVNTVTVTKVWAPGMGPKADAIVTNQRGVALGISTADCGPILFADAGARVIGAAHAGWRGALAGIGESAIAAMETLGARRKHIVAVLGPTISQANYEVGFEVRDRFVASDSKNGRFFKPSGQADHFLFDLPGVIVARLAAAGIAASAVNLCTYAEPERFFSYRRTTHQRDTDYGRMLSTIMLAD
jgi:polyphenol oxidase